MPDDMRYYEGRLRHEINTAAASATRIADARVNSGSHPVAPWSVAASSSR